MARTLKRTLELQLGRSITEREYDRVAEMMQDLRQLTEEMKTAWKNNPEKYDLLVWQVTFLSDDIIGQL